LEGAFGGGRCTAMGGEVVVLVVILAEAVVWAQVVEFW